MPDFKTLPQRGSLSIEEALYAGKKAVSKPRKYFISCGLLLAIMLAFVSIWLLPIVIICSIVVAIIYTSIMRSRWRIWAYSGVADIHQFERCAELAGLLYLQSPMDAYGIMTDEQKRTLIELQKRFEEDTPFINDQQIGEESKVYLRQLFPSTNPEPEITINDKGIQIKDAEFAPWSEIWNERVAVKSFNRQRSYLSEGDHSSYNVNYFCFSCSQGSYETALEDLDVSAEQMDLMLYIHRGRCERQANK